MDKIKISDLVKDGQEVNFVYYRAGHLYYEHDNGLLFPVPVVDIGEATFHAKHKAITLMRYIRQHLDTAQKEGVEYGGAN
jgi:hypothetical protein